MDEMNVARFNAEQTMMEEVKNIERKVVSIEQMLNSSRGELVDIPGFNDGEKFTVRLRRPSLLSLIKTGKVPNDLLIEANKMFVKGGSSPKDDINDPKALSDMMNLLEIICENAFVEPSYQEIKGAGIELTDSQMLAIFAYTQSGVNSLKSFR